MSQPEHITALDLPLPARDELDDDMRRYLDACEQKLGMVPNVLRAYSFDQDQLRNFINQYNELMLGDSSLSRLEREMIAVVVSSVNRCYYCLVAHGQAVRALSADPRLGEILGMNYRVAELPDHQIAMLDFAVALTEEPEAVDEADRHVLREAGFGDRAIWDIVAVTAFFNMTNRVAVGGDMMPNPEYHAMDR